MERGVANLHQSPVEDDEVEAKFRHQSLLEDFTRLKKEVVSKKRRMRNWKKKRAVLRAEVRFLRKRYEDILQSQSQRMRNESQQLQSQRMSDFGSHFFAGLERNPYETTMGNKVERVVEMELGNQMSVERLSKKRKYNNNHNHNGNQTQSLIGRNQSQSNAAALVSYPIMKRHTEETERVEEFEGGDQIGGVEKLPKNNNRLIVDTTGKRVTKKRVTWKDQVVP